MKILLLILILSQGTLATGYTRARETEGTSGENLQRKSSVMGAEVQIVLFNRRTYKERVLPAYKLFLERGDHSSLIELLRECIQKLDAKPRLAEELLWNREIIEDDIGILTGTVYYSPDGNRSNQDKSGESDRIKHDYARELLASNILRVLCVPREKGLNPTLDMTNSPLIHYLHDRSKWIKDVLTLARSVHGKSLELPLGESSETFTKQDIQKFSAELDKIAKPHDADLGKEFDNLRALLRAAVEDPDLTLVLSIT